MYIVNHENIKWLKHEQQDHILIIGERSIRRIRGCILQQEKFKTDECAVESQYALIFSLIKR